MLKCVHVEGRLKHTPLVCPNRAWSKALCGTISIDARLGPCTTEPQQDFNSFEMVLKTNKA